MLDVMINKIYKFKGRKQGCAKLYIRKIKAKSIDLYFFGKMSFLSTYIMIIIIQMIDQEENLLLKYAQKIRNQQHFQKILQRQDMTFDYKPFKIENLLPEKALIIYQNLRHRYNVSKQIAIEPNGWHEYEKRLFVWFMIIYAYYLEKESSALDPPIDYKQKINFEVISRIFFDKSPFFLEFQFLNLFKVTDKMAWTERDDALLTKAVRKCPIGRWTQVSVQIFESSGKQRFISSKNCRERWQNHLDESKIKGNWTVEEDKTIIQFVEVNGKKWSKMKSLLGNRRTEHMIKNRYHSLITKNRANKYEKEQQIAKRLLQKYEGIKIEKIVRNQQNNEINTEQVQQEKQNGLQIQLKEQNFSNYEDSNNPPEVCATVAIKQQEGSENDVAVNLTNKINIPNNVDHPKMYEQPVLECEENQNLYPFHQSNIYNFQNEVCGYPTYDHLYELRNAHVMLLFQQYMYGSTNDTYATSENQLMHQSHPQAEEERSKKDKRHNDY